MNTGHSTDGKTDSGIVERVVGEQLYDALFEHGNRVAMLLEPDGRVVDANAPALALGAFDRDDDIGEPVWAMPPFAGTASRAVRADDPELGRADRALDRIDTLLEDVQSVAEGYAVEERTRAVACRRTRSGRCSTRASRRPRTAPGSGSRSSRVSSRRTAGRSRRASQRTAAPGSTF